MDEPNKKLALASWIKWTKGLSRKTKVIKIGYLMGIDRRIAACLCMEVWEWADDNAEEDGHASSVTSVTLDSIIGAVGLCDALKSVGWLAEDSTGLLFLHWDKHNGNNAKKRAQDAYRQRRRRLAVTDHA